MVPRRPREGVPLPTAVISAVVRSMAVAVAPVEWEGVVVLVVGGVVEDPLPDGNEDEHMLEDEAHLGECLRPSRPCAAVSALSKADFVSTPFISFLDFTLFERHFLQPINGLDVPCFR